jgi:hypothetical protein
MPDFEGDGYFEGLDAYEARREYEEWLDSQLAYDPSDDPADWPDDMIGEEDFA